MAVVVSLRDVVDAIDVLDDECQAYLNQVTGELVTISDEEVSIVEDEEDWGDFPDWQQESLALAKKVLESSDYLLLPSKFDIHEYAIMQRFCNLIEPAELRGELLDQIRGSGAFRRFKSALHRHGIQDQWYRFQHEALEAIAIEWLESHGIAYTRDARLES